VSLGRGVAPGLVLVAGLLWPLQAQAAAGSFPELVDRLEQTWKARDVQGYLELWIFETAEERAAEEAFVRGLFAGETELRAYRPQWTPSGGRPRLISAQSFTIVEPRASVEQWTFRLKPRQDGWWIESREPQGRIDGLVHLSLAPGGYRADGLTLRLEDFTLSLHHGTLFLPPEALGPTLLVFVGDATVRFRPRPATEQSQLRRFCGSGELVENVHEVYVRIHPGDLHRVLDPVRLDPDPKAAERFEAAQRVFRDQSGRSFVLDVSLPGAPWSLLPSLGDALVSFRTRNHGTLTLTENRNDFEGISLFDRDRQLQISLYPPGGRDTRYNEDNGREADVISHDLRVRFDPLRYGISGEDTLRIHMLVPGPTVRLRLHESLRVQSVTSKEAGSHLFFRVRGQDSLMVALGPIAGTLEEIELTVRYAGVLAPGVIDREVLQVQGSSSGPLTTEIPMEELLSYTNRNAWYPRTSADDHATAVLHLDVPEGYTSVSGGRRTDLHSEARRTIAEYRLDQPGKYISAVVGRLVEVGSRQEGRVQLLGFGSPRIRAEAAGVLARSAEILRFYEREFGPCPYATLNVVVAEGETPGGHSPPGMIVLSRRPLFLRQGLRDDPGSVSDAPDFFLAHEVAHQWWGHGVAGQNYHERWLSEGLAQYAAALWVRESRGEEAFRSTLKRMSSWALARTDEGPVSLGHRVGHIKNDPQSFRAVVYDKAAYVLHMLRGIVGEEHFRAALTGLQEQRRYTKIGTDDLREALEQASGTSLSAYFDEWIYGTQLPLLRYRSKSAPAPGGGHRTTIEVSAEGLPGPVPLEIALSHEGGREVRTVTLDPQGGSWTIDTTGRLRKAEINTDYRLLARIERR